MKKVQLVALFVLTFIAGMANGVMISQQKPELIIPEVMVAFNQCLLEIEKGCPMLLGYAKSLEAENARLNRVIKMRLVDVKTCSEPSPDQQATP